MPDDKMLSQEEIDALLKPPAAGEAGGEAADQGGGMDQAEIDALLAQSTAGESGGEAADQGGGMDQAEIDALLAQSTAGESGGEAAGEAIAEPGLDAAPVDAVIEDAPVRITEIIDQEPEMDLLSVDEKDALGEIGNISMGTASTTLSELLQQRVTITSPEVRLTTQEKLFATFEVPYITIQVQFKDGLEGFNILIMRLHDAMVMANLMMGGDGTEIAEEISEMEISAASEAMNQMIGTASTSLATLFSRSINISPPETTILDAQDRTSIDLPMEDPIVIVSFKLIVGELLDTEIMQILSMETARSEASLLWQGIYGVDAPAAADTAATAEAAAPVTPAAPAAPTAPAAPAASGVVPESGSEQVPGEIFMHRERAPSQKMPPRGAAGGASPAAGLAQRGPDNVYNLDINQNRLAMLMDIPLKATVVLGRSKKPIKEILGYTPGAIVELSSEVSEPVEILVNGVLVARGEIVVVNENFGVKITDILTPSERIGSLTK